MEMLKPIAHALNLPVDAIGLDIGSRSVKCVRLKKAKGQISLEDAFVIDRMKVTDLSASVAAAFEVHGEKNPTAYVSGSSVDVQSLDLRLPQMPKKELDLVVQKNLTDFLQRPLEELAYDYRIVWGTEQQLVRVYYSERETTRKILTDLAIAGVTPKVLSSSVLSTLEALIFNEYVEPDRSYCTVEIGEASTKTSLIYQNEIIASHTAFLGFGSINAAIMDHADKSYMEADAFKSQLSDLLQINDSTLVSVIEGAYIKILEDIQTDIDILKDNDNIPHLSEIFLSGGGAVSGPASSMLSEYNNSPVTVVNPFRRIQTISMQGQSIENPEYLGAMSPLFAAAVGSALGGLQW